jgi:hypothetical protein
VIIQPLPHKVCDFVARLSDAWVTRSWSSASLCISPALKFGLPGRRCGSYKRLSNRSPRLRHLATPSPPGSFLYIQRPRGCRLDPCDKRPDPCPPDGDGATSKPCIVHESRIEFARFAGPDGSRSRLAGPVGGVAWPEGTRVNRRERDSIIIIISCRLADKAAGGTRHEARALSIK